MTRGFTNDKIEIHDHCLPPDKHPAIFSRIIECEETAIKDCLMEYGSFVWVLAKKFTGSTQDAEDATQEIFVELWKQIDRFDSGRCRERDFVFAVAYRLLTDRKHRDKRSSEQKGSSISTAAYPITKAISAR